MMVGEAAPAATLAYDIVINGGSFSSPSAAFAAAPAELEQASNGVGLPGGGTPGGVTNQMVDDGETQLPIVKSEREKIGRNDPCWCGSGKKYKKCHGA